MSVKHFVQFIHSPDHDLEVKVKDLGILCLYFRVGGFKSS